MYELKVKNLHKSFGSLEVIKNLNLSIRENEFGCILGVSGCGKTTLIKILAGLLPYDNGDISIKNHYSVSVMFQESRLLKWRTVKENISLGLELKNEEINEGKIDEMLKLVGLLEFKDTFPNTLSGGMQQRVALARTLLLEPKILLMDEPLSSLDPRTRRRLQAEILRIKKQRDITMLFVTHSVEEAIYLGDRIFVLSERPTKVKKEIEKKEFDDLESLRERIHRLLEE